MNHYFQRIYSTINHFFAMSNLYMIKHDMTGESHEKVIYLPEYFQCLCIII